MLRTLRIRDLVIIDDLTVEFGTGLNLLTGETGAGKSILVDALGLVGGDRADRELIRTGAPMAIVEALFEWSERSAVVRWARDRGQTELAESGQAAIRRELPRSGAGRIFVNGSPWTQTMLRELGALLLELHGQHDHRTLLAPEHHLNMLDRFGGHAGELERVAAAYRSVIDLHGRRTDLREHDDARQARLRELDTVVREIDAVGPRPGELAEIDRERRLLRNAARVTELLDRAVALTYDGEPSAAELAASAARPIEELAEIDPGLEELAGQVRAAAVELQDAGSALRDYRDRAEFDPARLEKLETRRLALERLLLRFEEDEQALLERREQSIAEIESLRGLGRDADALERELLEAEATYAACAEKLGGRRRQAAAELAPAVERQLGELALGRARFDVALAPARGTPLERGDREPVPLSLRGAERAEFRVAANPGEPPRPLHKAASGGELARIMLALHVAADSGKNERAVVFDEVDAGVGGAVADAVGARLGKIARARQVLCVTHLPQVAAYADHHLAVRKTVAGGRTSVTIQPLSKSDRVDEIARMLGTRKPTESSRLHATELLRGAGRPARQPTRRGA